MTTTTPGTQHTGETDTERYARQTRNAVVFVAVVVGLSMAVSLVLGIVAVISVTDLQHSLVTTSSNSGCFVPGDPSTVGLPVC
jgi:hypothetical protein